MKLVLLLAGLLFVAMFVVVAAVVADTAPRDEWHGKEHGWGTRRIPMGEMTLAVIITTLALPFDLIREAWRRSLGRR